VVLVGNGEPAVHGMVQIDGGAGIAAAVGGGRQLQAMVVEGDGVIIGDAAGVVEAEQVLPVAVCGQRLTGRAGLLGGDGEALVVLGEIGGEHLVGLLDRAGPSLT